MAPRSVLASSGEDLDQLHLRVGAEIRARRRARDQTLKELAFEAGISYSFLSQIERGHAAPSMISLHRIATALGTTAPELMMAKTPSQALQVEASSGPRVANSHDATDSGASRVLASALEPMRVTEVTGVPRMFLDFWEHPTDEFVYVVGGNVELQVGDQYVVLGPGDSMSFDGEVPHRYRRIGDEIPKLLIIESPTNRRTSD